MHFLHGIFYTLYPDLEIPITFTYFSPRGFGVLRGRYINMLAVQLHKPYRYYYFALTLALALLYTFPCTFLETTLTAMSAMCIL